MAKLDPHSPDGGKWKPLSLAHKFAILTKLDRSKHTPIKVELTLCCAGLPKVDELSKGDFQVTLYKKRRGKQEGDNGGPASKAAAEMPAPAPAPATGGAARGARGEAGDGAAQGRRTEEAREEARAETREETRADSTHPLPASGQGAGVPDPASAPASTAGGSEANSHTSISDKRRWTLVGRTEVVRGSLAPRFSRTFVINYWPGKVQPLLCVVTEVEDYGLFKTREVVGECTFMLADLHDHPDKELELDLVARDQPAGTYVGTVDVGLEQVSRIMHLDMWTDVLFYADSGTMGRFQGRPMKLQQRALPLMEAPAFLHTMRDVEKQRDAGRTLARMSAMQRFFTLRRRRNRRARRSKHEASGRTFAQYSQRVSPHASLGGQGGTPAQRLSTPSSENGQAQGSLTARTEGGSGPQREVAAPPPSSAAGHSAAEPLASVYADGRGVVTSGTRHDAPEAVLAEHVALSRLQLAEQEARHRQVGRDGGRSQ
eukprot:jgi/Mesvir1/16383/Mv18126-RA.3